MIRPSTRACVRVYVRACVRACVRAGVRAGVCAGGRAGVYHMPSFTFDFSMAIYFFAYCHTKLNRPS